MRTRADWFSLLPEDVREKAVANMKREDEGGFGRYMSRFSPSMDWALSGAFYWVDSPEGEEYWATIAEDPKWKEYELNDK